MESEYKEVAAESGERKRILKESMRIAEQYFQTETDPEQIPINDDSAAKLESLSPHGFEYELDEQGKPISWTVVVPTQQELAEQFLQGEISEKELFDQSVPEPQYKALYLCSAFTVPEHRGKGLAIKVLSRSLSRIPQSDDAVYIAWPFSEDGRHLIEKFQSQTKHKVLVRKSS